MAARTQWRAAGFGIIGLDYGVLGMIAGLLWPPVELDADCFGKIRALEGFELERMDEEMKRKDAEGNQDHG